MTQVKERPILFSAPMVRAILDGRKTVTRRPVKADWIQSDRAPMNTAPGLFHFWCSGEHACPYGEPGQRLWVRESFWHAGGYVQTYPEDDVGSWSGSRRVHYRADGNPPNEPNRHYPNGLRNGSYSAAEPNKIWRARPSIHMPRWACRILLEITDVRVERLQNISEEQAQAEGVQRDSDGWADYLMPSTQCCLTPRESFKTLWASISGAKAWDANPWVWVVEFRRVQP
ncbi:hypothetical protein [Pseudomonas sp. KCJK8993]|uniref:hypothetical protein n=1 Tax=Pseudomonas sp. KCJK8993 TaxID=3344565 RepID=UPI003906A92D